MTNAAPSVTADKTVVWKTPKINGIPPSPRSSHSATAVDNRLFVFGGFDGRRYYNDLHILDLGAPPYVHTHAH